MDPKPRPRGLQWRLFASFFKIGAFTFGGGWAMISLMEKEIVDRNGWLTRREFYDCVALCQALPGVIAVNMAVSVGHKAAGRKAALLSALGALLPSFLIILAIAIFLSPEAIKTDPVLSAVFKGVRPAVVALIAAPVIYSARAAGITWRTVAIPAVVAVMVWSRVPFVSNPVLYICLAALVGWWLQRLDFRRKEGGSKP